ncbi:MAG: Arylsulfotransferase [Chloroflexi bacterium]|nr:Arylsulfotransferase [Chloroflexota bacterium]
MRRHPWSETERVSQRTARLLSNPIQEPVRWSAAILLALTFLRPVSASAAAPSASPSVTVKPSLQSGQPVGTAITWNAKVTGIKNAVYRFSVGPLHGPSRVVRDFSPAASVTWVLPHEGTYSIRATVKSGFAATGTTEGLSTYTAASRVKGTSAVVSVTANPLVALYSAPACARGTVTVMFRSVKASTWQSTSPQPCTAEHSVNVFVAGMQKSSQYLLRHVVTDGKQSTTSAALSFNTGKPSTALKISSFTVKHPATSDTDETLPVLFHSLLPNLSPTIANPVATDLSGNVIWYYDTLRSGLAMVWPLRMASANTFFVVGRDRYRTSGDNVFREVDLAGNTVRETNVSAVNAQLATRKQEAIYGFHHDALSLPNGDTAVIGATQAKVSGHNVMGDMIVVLDANFKVVWTWDAFDYLDPSRQVEAGDKCGVTYPGGLCPLPDPNAIDWLHSNSLGWSPQDNDLTMSLRHQDWVIKIDYQGGHGTGKVVWRLGKGGDFTITSTDANPWFSHQHDAHFIDANTLVLFDNGNTRCKNGSVKGCNSRGQVLKLDEKHHVATSLLNVDLGVYALALGSAQLLNNGDLDFLAGIPNGRAIEVRSAGSTGYVLDSTSAEYRAYRLKSLPG